jgi:hypothetical protein
MTTFFTRIALRGVLIVGGGVTPADGAVSATAMVTIAEAVGSVSISWRSGWGGEARGLQMENVSIQQYWCMATRQHVHTWRTRLLVPFVCARLGDPAGPRAGHRSTPWMVRGSCLCPPPPRLLSPPGASSFCGLAAGQSLGYSSPLDFGRGAGEEVVWPRDVGLRRVAPVQICVPL